MSDGLPVEEKKRKHVKDMVLYDLLGLEPEATQGKKRSRIREEKQDQRREVWSEKRSMVREEK